MRATQDRQKSYADLHRRDIGFAGQMDSSMRGLIRDGKRPMEEVTEGEDGIFEWEEGFDDEKGKEKLLLVGKIWASKSTNAKAAIESMIRLWNPTKPMAGNIIDAKEKVFVFRFGCERDKAKVLEGQPWHFDKFLWCFNEPNCEGKITDVPLFFFPIWTRVYDLPIAGRLSETNIKKIGAALGFYIVMEVGLNNELDRAVRIRVLQDVRAPLKSIVPIKMKGGRVVEFDVKYERLPLYCYGCGHIGHGEKDCDEGPYEEGELRFGIC
ncbi:uncharacterized protein LOC141628042 [Silene latifolia]|uniref:uncharacterized protein LOC141628042 n=1 Tax=Silene latifolia TaxID=37657 RepID=UPI003D785CAD